MKINPLYFIIVMALSSVLMGHTILDRTKSIEGTWVRKGDHLKVRIEKGNALIIDEGDQKFPCDVSAFPIYKDIREVNTNHWTCHFLVVTMGSCNTNYEAGEIIIDKKGELVIICPGFSSKVYSKINPRYDSPKD